MKGNLLAFAIGVILAYGVGTVSYRSAQTNSPAEAPVVQAAVPGAALAAAPPQAEPVPTVTPVQPRVAPARNVRRAEQVRARRSASPVSRVASAAVTRPTGRPAAAPIAGTTVEDQEPFRSEPEPVREIAEARIPEVEPASPDIDPLPPVAAPDRQRSRGRSVAIVGGSAAGGAIAGGVAGGAKGAALGGIIGAAGGYIYDRITRR